MKSAMMAKPADKMVQSGNSRVKVTLYGWVNKAVRLARTPQVSSVQVIDNSHSGSRLGVRAVGKLNPNTTGVGLIEADFRANHRHGTGFDSPTGGQINIRHTVASLTHKDMGTISLGHSWVGGGFAHGGSFSGTGGVFGIWGPDGDGVKATATVNGMKVEGKPRHGMTGRGFPTLFGGREDRLRYDSPNLMGASVNASYNENRGWSSGFSLKGLPGVKAMGLRLNAGYASDPERGDMGTTSFAVSAGVQHNASGLSINGVYDQEQYKGGHKPTAWMGDLSWTGKVTDAGSTSLTVGYGQWTDGMMGKTTRYHFAVKQDVDSAAAELYFGVGYDTGTVTHKVANKNLQAYTIADGSDGQLGQPDIDYASPPSATTYSYDAACGAPDETASPSQADREAYAGSSCSIERDGVIVIIAGVRIKF
ncbi:MAG: hypothetical protein F4114_17465 [Rhodospirillaceae bacterium]|nr:hypothetical protein [Rhodospirillaceae bacterium]MYB13006.1 hypothetical protein [Rhodospirillaceae bacterium]MYI50858.1 hypothetical protein [Rhodospirillaceae bacterium]